LILKSIPNASRVRHFFVVADPQVSTENTSRETGCFPLSSTGPGGVVPMITINQTQLDSVEYLIQQSAQGNHILFEVDQVRKVFSINPPPMTEEQVREVETHIEKLITIGSFSQQKSYIQSLPEEVLVRVIKTYFNIVENSVFEKSPVRH
jgi:hypothetical protein